MDPHFARFGLSASQWGVLRALQRAEDEGIARLRLTDLGRRLLVRPPSVGGVVGRLEREGLVAKLRTRSDQRARVVVLTPAGRELVRQVMRRHPGQIRAVLGGLDREDMRRFHRLMDRFANHLERLDAARGPTRSDST